MRRIPDKVLPHRNLVQVHPYLGGGASGRVYDDPVVLERALIIDDVQVLRDQYDSETILQAVLYFERALLERVPEPETKIIIWHGTPDAREAYVVKAGRYQHPRIADVLEVRLR